MIFLEAKKRKDPTLKRAIPITFVLPAYNVASYLKKCVDSILKIDYPKEKIEVIIVDDGSTDNTYVIAKSLASKYNQIRVLHKQNEGKAATLNYGIERVNTELTALLDADTLLQRDILKKAIPYFEDKKIVAVMSRLVPLNKRSFLSKVQAVEYAFVGFFRKLLSNISALPITPALSIYKTSFFKMYGGYDPGNLTEDFEIALRAQSHDYDIACVLDSYAKTIVPEKFVDLKRQRVRWNYGTLFNFYKYKRLFSFRYGDLGLFSLPTQILMILVAFVVFGLAIYNLVSSGIDFVNHLILGWRPELNFSTFSMVLFFSDPKIIFAIFSVLISLSFFTLVKKHTKERISFLNYMVYIFVYAWLTVYFFAEAIVRLIFRKPPLW
jgi:cellulose synthase/poly-beta-1,6-N-acetylglucosamine synthase-like glycosyltransferase